MYGNCFVFNFQENTSESVALPGPGYGLSLVLNLEQEHYGQITQTTGARKSLQFFSLILDTLHCIGNRVTVHSRKTPPLIEDNGLMVEPNTATDIAIERVSTFSCS